MKKRFSPGDLVVYKKQKRSRRPGPRAHDVASAVQAGRFSYVVDKYWIVVDNSDDDTVIVLTRRGKRHRVSTADPNLRRATWWQRLRYRNRYQQLAASGVTSPRGSLTGKSH